MEDQQVLVSEKQIKIYTKSAHVKEAATLFRELKENDRRITQKEFCILRNNLFITIELGNAHLFGVCASILAGIQGQCLENDPKEMERFETFVQFKKQTKPSVPKVFVSQIGSNMASGLISTQLCSLWQKIGSYSKSEKSLCCNILMMSGGHGSSRSLAFRVCLHSSITLCLL